MGKMFILKSDYKENVPIADFIENKNNSHLSDVLIVTKCWHKFKKRKGSLAKRFHREMNLIDHFLNANCILVLPCEVFGIKFVYFIWYLTTLLNVNKNDETAI